MVTHLPQIACFADRHVRVSKDAGTATIETLDDHERVRGAVADARRSRRVRGRASGHAEELLSEAERVRAGA